MAGGNAVETALDALDDVVSRLMGADTEQQICEVAVNAATEVFDAPLGGLWLYDPEANELQLAAKTKHATSIVDTDVVYRPGNSLSWKSFTDGAVRLYETDTTDESLYNSESRIASELIIPVGEYGVLNVATVEKGSFDETDRQLARILATTVESALHHSEREHALQVKNNRLEEFVGIVSHDLRNPLTVAEGNLELARKAQDNEYLQKTADAIDRMGTLIDELLTLAEQGYVVEDRTNVDLAALAEQAWTHIHAPEGTLVIDGTAKLFCDESRLLQVFENLFRNALDHGGEDVTIRVGPLEPLHTSTRVEYSEHSDGFYVLDNGPGIPDSQQAAVFETGHSTDSTGLGLAIVKRIVEAHGWDIDLTQAVGGGARFDVTGKKRAVAPFDGG